MFAGPPGCSPCQWSFFSVAEIDPTVCMGHMCSSVHQSVDSARFLLLAAVDVPVRLLWTCLYVPWVRARRGTAEPQGGSTVNLLRPCQAAS